MKHSVEGWAVVSRGKESRLLRHTFSQSKEKAIRKYFSMIPEVAEQIPSKNYQVKRVRLTIETINDG